MEISFKDILNIIKKNIIFILIISILCALCSFFITNFFIPKTYKTSVKLYVKSAYDGSSGYDSLQSHKYAQNLVATYIQMLDTNVFYTSLSKALDEKYTASQLDAMVSFVAIDETEIFEATVVTKNPTEAKNIADAVAVTAPDIISQLNNNDAQLKIVDGASVPKSPTSPNLIKNVLIAFFVGLVVSLIISFVRDYFDTNIKYDEDMTTLEGLPVLAAIPDFEDFASARSEAVELSENPQQVTEATT